MNDPEYDRFCHQCESIRWTVNSQVSAECMRLDRSVVAEAVTNIVTFM